MVRFATYSEADIALYVYSSQLQTYKVDAYNLCFTALSLYIAHVNKVFNHVIVNVLSWRGGMQFDNSPEVPGSNPICDNFNILFFYKIL